MTLTKHFDSSSFICPCGRCSYSSVDTVFINKRLLHELEVFISFSGHVPIILSGLRCKEYDKKYCKSSSPHTTGDAVDVAFTSREAFLSAIDFFSASPNITRLVIHSQYLHLESYKKCVQKIRDLRTSH